MSKNGLGPPSRSSSMRPPPDPPSRFPLMTPSASPPVQRPFGRQSDGPSPIKKRRVSGTPSLLGPGARSYSVVSASSSSVTPAFAFDASVDPGEDLHVARRASSFRVLNVWSQLADKYSRRLDEDDIVDLEKETIVKDYGVLRSSNDMFEIGCFADEHERAERLDNGQPLTPADDEPDELDAFADIQDIVSRSETDGDEEDGLELSQQSKRLPPVREVDPADAADLAEFLKAEQSRKETLGDPDGDEDEDEEFEEIEEGEEDYGEEGDGQGNEAGEEEDGGENFGADTAFPRSDAEGDSTKREVRSSGDEEEEIYQESIHDDDDDRNNHLNYSRVSTPSGSPEFDILDISYVEKGSDTAEAIINIERAVEDAQAVAEDPLVVASGGDSEDELGAWDYNEGSTLYSVGDFSEGSADEKVRKSSREHTPTRTPEPLPLSRKGTSRGRRQKFKLSNGTPSVRIPPKAPPRKKTTASRTPSLAPIIQLQTPPRSTSFGPEARNDKVTSTYSRKRRGKSSRPKKTPMRIESTVSGSSNSEAESEPAPSNKGQKQKQTKPRPNRTPVNLIKKFKFVPEVYIDGPPWSSPRKLSKNELALDNRLDFPRERANLALHQKSAKAKGKARATEIDDYGSVHEIDRESKSVSPDVLDLPGATRSQSRERNRLESPKRLSIASKKRRRAYSPALDEFSERASANDVVMVSPPHPSSRNPSRRASSSRQSVANEIDSRVSDEREAGPSSRTSIGYRSRSQPSGEQPPESTSRPQLPPELSTFSFTPPHPSSAGFQSYGGAHFAPSLAQQQPPAPVPNFQDPNAQYHLAQALQSLSFLMGGALSFPPSPLTGSHAPPPPPSLGQHGHQPWPPYTPRHHNRSMNIDTPQSTASAPPTSSPLGSDYSESVPSSPTKRPVQDRRRSRTRSRGPKDGRPKSAIRETPLRSRSREQRRVSFSSPEATHIEDRTYEFGSDSVIEVEDSDADDSDVERRRQRRETQSSRSLQLQSQPRRHARAQTPAPPGPTSLTEFREDFRRSIHNDPEPRRRIVKGREGGRNPGSISEASHHVNRKGYR